MKRLTEQELSELLKRCSTYNGYSAVIVFSSAGRRQEFADSMKYYLKKSADETVEQTTRAGSIKFKNGSYIRAVVADLKVRGLIANEIICDDLIQDTSEIKARVTKIPYSRPRKNRRSRWTTF